MGKVNSALGPQAVKIYPPGHINHGNAQNIQQTHTETAQYYKEFITNHKQTCDQFKVYFSKFDEIYGLLKQRDKAFDLFKHYFEKMKQLKEENQVSRSSMAKDPTKLAKEEQRIVRV